MKALEDNVEKSLLRQERELEEEASAGGDIVSLSRAMKEMKAKHEVRCFPISDSGIHDFRKLFFLLIDGPGTTAEEAG